MFKLEMYQNQIETLQQEKIQMEYDVAVAENKMVVLHSKLMSAEDKISQMTSD